MHTIRSGDTIFRDLQSQNLYISSIATSMQPDFVPLYSPAFCGNNAVQSEYLFKSPFTGSGCIVTSDGLFTLNIKSHPGLTDSTILQGLTEDPHLSGSEMSLDTDNDTQSDDDMPLSKIREQFKASKIPLSKISVNMNVPSGIMTSEKGQTCIAQPSVSQVDSNVQTKNFTTQYQFEYEAYPETVGI